MSWPRRDYFCGGMGGQNKQEITVKLASWRLAQSMMMMTACKSSNNVEKAGADDEDDDERKGVIETFVT